MATNKMFVLAVQGNQDAFLIVTSREKETGFVARRDKVRSPVMQLGSFLKFGGWEDWPTGKEPPISPEKMAQFRIIGGEGNPTS